MPSTEVASAHIVRQEFSRLGISLTGTNAQFDAFGGQQCGILETRGVSNLTLSTMVQVVMDRGLGQDEYQAAEAVGVLIGAYCSPDIIAQARALKMRVPAYP